MINYNYLGPQKHKIKLMKLLKTLALLLMAGLFIVSCQKEYSEESGGAGNATGTLKAGGSGQCLPSIVQGIYMAGTNLTATNYINVEVDFATAGSYLITTNTVNGYSFTGVGIATAAGIQSVKLAASGTPTAAGANTFTVTFGTSECNIVVDVLAAGTGAATFTLAGAPATCTGAVVNGIYKVNTATGASNSVALSVNVTAAGTYNITTPASNGIIFAGAGALPATGPATIILAANGVPTAAGSFNTTVTAGGGNCTFSVTTVAAGGGGTPAAVYTLGGAPDECTGAVLAGTYQEDVTMTAANKATLNVNVTTAGTYNITTTTVNGVKFSGTGTFTATGAQSVVLTATGLPDLQGTFDFPVTGLTGNSCKFSITFIAPPPPAVFTLGDCSSATPAGTYAIGTALGASNTVAISATVTTAGVYSATTNTVNGMSFSVSNAVFSGTGPQTITLVGSGTPAAAGNFDYTVTAGASTCTFSVTVVAAPSQYTWSFKVGSTTYSGECDEAELDQTTPADITITGENAAAGSLFTLSLVNFTGPIGTGDYSGNVTGGSMKVVESFGFNQSPLMYGFTAAFPNGAMINSKVTTFNNTTRVIEGTFSGTARNLGGTGNVTITDGKFKARFP